MYIAVMVTEMEKKCGEPHKEAQEIKRNREEKNMASYVDTRKDDDGRRTGTWGRHEEEEGRGSHTVTCPTREETRTRDNRY